MWRSMSLRSLRAVAALLAMIVLDLLVAAPAQAQTFTDVHDDEWFCEAVEALASEGAAAGYADGTFRPYEPISRAHFAAMMAGVLHLTPHGDAPFADVSSVDWFGSAVSALHAIGVVQGGTSGLFLPASEISRQQASSLTMRALAWRLSGESAPTTVLMSDATEAAPWLGGFRDRDSVAAVHALSVANAYRAGIISGFADQRFYPLLGLTRGQAAGILYEALLMPLVMSTHPPEVLPAELRYPTLGIGSSGAVVAWMERRLAALSYRPGVIDGVYDAATADAVMAFQKIERLERTGTATDAVQRCLAWADAPEPRQSVGGDRVEVDLSRQVLLLIRDGDVQWTIPVASGAQGTRTPTGTFSIQRRLPYWRESHLGMLYKPAYFYGGYAIHGSRSVPPFPASHGCVRVAVSTMDDLYSLLPVGMRVDIYY